MVRASREPGGFVRLLEVDPELGSRLDKDRLAELSANSWVTTWTLGIGVWPGADWIDQAVALYVITGTLVRAVTVEGHTCLELVGPGQVLRPEGAEVEESVGSEVAWQVLAESWIAVLDRPFLRHVGAYPEIVTELMDRAVLRARSLSVRFALVGIRNLEKRLLTLLWHLADTYGHVHRDGVVIDLVLSHDVLARLVSAQRSSVTRSLKQLAAAGYVSRSARRGFVLHGSGPPQQVLSLED